MCSERVDDMPLRDGYMSVKRLRSCIMSQRTVAHSLLELDRGDGERERTQTLTILQQCLAQLLGMSDKIDGQLERVEVMKARIVLNVRHGP